MRYHLHASEFDIDLYIKKPVSPHLLAFNSPKNTINSDQSQLETLRAGSSSCLFPFTCGDIPCTFQICALGLSPQTVTRLKPTSVQTRTQYEQNQTLKQGRREHKTLAFIATLSLPSSLFLITVYFSEFLSNTAVLFLLCFLSLVCRQPE